MYFLYLNVTKEFVWERLFFIKLFLLINSGGKLKLEHHCFSTPNGIIGLPRWYRLASLQTVACQAPWFMGFPRLEYWSGWPFSSPGNFPDPGTESASHPLQTDALLMSHQASPIKHLLFTTYCLANIC